MLPAEECSGIPANHQKLERDKEGVPPLTGFRGSMSLLPPGFQTSSIQLGDSPFQLFWATHCVVFCYGSPRKLTQMHPKPLSLHQVQCNSSWIENLWSKKILFLPLSSNTHTPDLQGWDRIMAGACVCVRDKEDLSMCPEEWNVDDVTTCAPVLPAAC